MPSQNAALAVFLLGIIAFSAGGCVVQRTVKEGNEVVASGYVVKAPVVVR